MLINDSKKLRDIQREFNEKFPYLKLEFYRLQHQIGEGTPARELLDTELTIGEVRAVHVEGDLSVHPNLKVSTLEKNFAELYGLNAQVFRRSGNLWLQTTATDEWTLFDQNRKGGRSERQYNEKRLSSE
ncbi:MAG: hypothetical protein KDC43_02375 [Saprospiraceae bacterium]|nr:hypothetical protein [Saprospiraceae bacterium]MCB0622783.1 hypothetical protein [Saprospiraceae bacterium]MCB0677939.1 hypothetical protein [Saprospiraceae bacterium]MCB0682356.1 hypothetical protein [Saprospiraceae bacterium]